MNLNINRKTTKQAFRRKQGGVFEPLSSVNIFLKPYTKSTQQKRSIDILKYMIHYDLYEIQ